jgi:hypothetical protein
MIGRPTITHLLALALLTSCAGEDQLTRLATRTDEFKQNVAAEIDVLWVIDNSESMADEQDALGASFTSFIDTLVASRVQYQIGVISTDPADGGVLHTTNSFSFIDAALPQAQASAMFLDNVKVGITGARAEKAFEATAMALGRGLGWRPGDPIILPNAGFPRDTAPLFIIMVSDEDDKTFGPVGYYARLFESLKGPGNEGMVSVSAIVSEPTGSDRGQEPCDGAQDVGWRYEDITNRTGGITASICGNFADALSRLSITAAGLKAFFDLTIRPNLSAQLPCGGSAGGQPFCVTVVDPDTGVDTLLPTSGNWRYITQSDFSGVGPHGAIEFTGELPAPEATVYIEYQEI